MRFHFPSFLLGYGAGAVTVAFGQRLRPLVLEVATAAYQLADALAARVAVFQEDVDDVLAVAKARARATRPRSGTRARARARS
jgi:hypothetical protein